MEPEPRKPSTAAHPRRSAFVHSVRTIRIVMCAPNLSYRVSTSRSVALAEPTSGTLQNTSPYSPLSSQLGYACSSRMRGHTARQNRATHSVAHSSLPGLMMCIINWQLMSLHQKMSTLPCGQKGPKPRLNFHLIIFLSSIRQPSPHPTTLKITPTLAPVGPPRRHRNSSAQASRPR